MIAENGIDIMDRSFARWQCLAQMRLTGTESSLLNRALELRFTAGDTGMSRVTGNVNFYVWIQHFSDLFPTYATRPYQILNAPFADKGCR